MEERTKPLTLALWEIKGVFKAKTNVRKGYCQDSLLINRSAYNKGSATWITESTNGSTKQNQTGEGSRIIHHGKDSSDNDVMWG